MDPNYSETNQLLNLIRRNGANIISERLDPDAVHEITLEIPDKPRVWYDDAISALGYSHQAYTDYCRNSWKKKLEIEKVIFNDPATIIYWNDGTKTVVKCEGEEFDPEKGMAMAIAKKFLGTSKTKGNYYDIFRKWLPEENIQITSNFDMDTIMENLVDAFKILNTK